MMYVCKDKRYLIHSYCTDKNKKKIEFIYKKRNLSTIIIKNVLYMYPIIEEPLLLMLCIKILICTHQARFGYKKTCTHTVHRGST